MSEVKYTESDIKTLSTREQMRLRPGMWIGKLGDGSQPDDGIYTLIKEVMDNSVDEFIMGAGKSIELAIGVGNVVTVRDYGRGIPLNSLADAVSKINTSGKYGSEAFKKIAKSGQTGRIVDLDHRRDRMFRGLVNTVKGALNHFRADMVASARRIMIVLETYGNLNVMTTDDETAMLYNLLKDLREKCAVDVETLGLDAWIDELDNLNRALQAAMAARVDEIAARTPLVYSTVRTEIDMAYRALVRRIDALEEVGGTGEGAPWAAFITDLNVVIERSNNLMAIRKGKAAAGKKKAEEQEQESEN